MVSKRHSGDSSITGEKENRETYTELLKLSICLRTPMKMCFVGISFSFRIVDLFTRMQRVFSISYKYENFPKPKFRKDCIRVASQFEVPL